MASSSVGHNQNHLPFQSGAAPGQVFRELVASLSLEFSKHNWTGPSAISSDFDTVQGAITPTVESQWLLE